MTDSCAGGCCASSCAHDTARCPDLRDTLQKMKKRGVQLIISEITPHTQTMTAAFKNDQHYGPTLKTLPFKSDDTQHFEQSITQCVSSALVMDYF